jgi:modified peptide precursor CbpA
LVKADTGFFILGVQHNHLEKENLMKKEKIIAYRRRCRKIGTGLSHYILLSPKEKKKE